MFHTLTQQPLQIVIHCVVEFVVGIEFHNLRQQFGLLALFLFLCGSESIRLFLQSIQIRVSSNGFHNILSEIHISQRFLDYTAHLFVHIVLPDMLCVCATLAAYTFGILTDIVPHICVEFAGSIFFLLPVYYAIHRRAANRAFDKARENVSMLQAVSFFSFVGIQPSLYLCGLPEIV